MKLKVLAMSFEFLTYKILFVFFLTSMPHLPLKRSFTLIEMLIVIVIIGILAAALVPRLQDIQGRARDSKRKADLLSIYNSLEVYFIDNNSYPLAPGMSYNTTANAAASTTTGWWIPGLSGYMTSIPVDPINNLPGARTT